MLISGILRDFFELFSEDIHARPITWHVRQT